MKPVPYDGPSGLSPQPPSRSFVFRLVLILAIALIAIESIGYYIDSLWFSSVGYQSVYWYRIKAEAAVFLVFFVLTTMVLWLAFRLIISSSGEVRRPMMMINGQTIEIPFIGNLKALARPLAAIIGFLVGLAFASDWETFALYANRTDLQGVADPIFGRPLSFFLFTMPVLNSVSAWLMAISFVVVVASVILLVTDTFARFRGVSMALSVLLASLAFQTFIGRYSLLLEDHSLFTGMSYADDKFLVHGLSFTAVALLAGAVIAAVNVAMARKLNLVAAIAIPALTYGVFCVAVPGYVSTFIVRPNELVKETPYIHNNIEFTRKAFDLDHVEEIPFEPKMKDAIFDPDAHKATLDNIRLWDWRALQDTLRQVQEIRTYYDFPDVDVDRYTIDGKPTAVMLTARELGIDKLPAGSRNWINERLIYTHGYGATMNPVSQFTREGLPQFILSNMPVESSRPEIQVKRPEIYYGELTNWPVYVKTKQKEFNFPEGDANNYSLYEGEGGIRMGALWRRLLLAFQVGGDLMKVPFSDDITPDSELLIHRNIMERVTTIAPFLTFDNDPYLVVGEDGGLYWMIDAFTSSDQYPYSRHIGMEDRSVNYIRNSVKIVVNAYSGKVDFYVFDTTDPIIAAYQRMLPGMFLPASAMPDFLPKKHVRYPELLFKVQASMYAAYHVENEQTFYNREDVWTIAQQGRSQGGGGEAQDAIEPFFVLMNFPGEKQLEFVSILPFTPASRNNLIGWMGARSDGDAYGKLRAYHFPKTRLVDGPLQIQAKIDQDPQLSSQLTLWNQQGSKVIRGNLLVIPLDDVLLFAEPIYLQAERSPMPQLRLVVLATQDRLAYGTTFDEALKTFIEGRNNGSLTAAPNAPTPEPSATPATESVQTLIDRANQAFSDYQRLTSEGKLGEAGKKLDDLKIALSELQRLRK